MLELQTYTKQFATPILQFRAQGHDELNASLLAEAAKMRAASDGAQKSNRGGWHSEGNLFEEAADCFARVRDMAQEAVWAANKKIGAKAPRDSLSLKLFAWMNANPMGGFNAPHTHPGAHWSGVYYVAQPDVEDGTSGMIEFLDPRSDLPAWRILKAPSFRPKKKLRPQPGDMILFPSYLVHWVYPNEADADRVTIAFNGTFSKAKK